MEEIIIYVREKLPIIIAYLIMFAEIIGQIFLKKFFKKGKLFLLGRVKTASEDFVSATNKLIQQKSEWDNDKAELQNTINVQNEKINKIEKTLKAYAKSTKGKTKETKSAVE